MTTKQTVSNTHTFPDGTVWTLDKPSLTISYERVDRGDSFVFPDERALTIAWIEVLLK